MTSYYPTSRKYLLAAIEKERHEIDRTDAKMNEAHRAHCRRIHMRHELDNYDEAARLAAIAAAQKKPVEVDDAGPAEIEL